MQYSQTGLKLTEYFEGCRTEAYYDSVGVLTIGYGHTGPDVRVGQVITLAQAEVLLQHDIYKAEACVNVNVKVEITQNEFDALVDFVFNLGCGSLKTSTLLKYLNAGNHTAAAGEFSRWVNAGGHRLAGLVERRKAEHDLFV